MWLYRLKPIFSFIRTAITFAYKFTHLGNSALTSQNMSI
nr:MAG TPA: hypothetical protein [Caudoviricetes sp.]